MAAELITPVDELTGIPLSVAPPEEPLPRWNPDVANWHHLYHPRSAPQLQTVGGLALRNSRVQLLPVRDHNTGKGTYHSFYKGPTLPDSEDEQFRLCVLSCGGYIPTEVIDLKGGEPKVRRISEAEIQALRRPPTPQSVTTEDVKRYRTAQIAVGMPGNVANMTNAEIRKMLIGRNQRQASMGYNNMRYAYEPIREFFQQYALQQPLVHIQEPYIDEFLSTTDKERRRNLGHWLLAKQSEVAAERIREVYAQAHRQGSLHPLMPSRPDSLIKFKLGDAVHRERLFPSLQSVLLGEAQPA